MKTKYLAVITGVILFSTTVLAQGAYNYVPIEVYGLNTIAGSTTVLRTSKVAPNINVNFEVKKPDGQLVNINAKTNASGVAITDFSDYHTKSAGVYYISAKTPEMNYVTRANFFTVHPGKLSTSVSAIYPKDQVVRSYDESAVLTVKLFDDFKNPIAKHKVKLISSSTSDQIKLFKNSDLTNEQGEVVFQITSKSPGLVSYSAYDVMTDAVLDNRAKVVYFNSNADIFQNKPFVRTAAYNSYGNSSLAVDHFEFEELPGDIKINQSVTLKVSAYDSNNQIVNNYSGKVRFSVDGSNSAFVSVPDDYTFTLQDQGSHVFSLAFTFKQAGSYNLKITDLGNLNIFGTKTVVVSGTATNNDSVNNSSGIVISNPISGTSSSNVQVISGTAAPGAKLKIFDNELEITSVIVDSSGKFSFTTGALPDGLHKIYAATVNDIGTLTTTSPIVDVNIDTKAATVSQVLVEPQGPVDPGTIVKIKLYVEENLSSASVVISGNVYNLIKISQGYYETSFSAPIEFGEYKLNFVLVDDLGNESKFTGDKVIKIGTLNPNDKAKPGKVTGLIATPEDSRVTLNWVAPASLSNPIKNYQIYYGFSPNQLTEAVDTFTSATTWYIPNLKNGTEYYFAIAAIDIKGNKSDGFDKIVSSKPGVVVADVLPPEIVNGSGGSDALKDMEKDASKSGPEILWLVLLSAIGGLLYSTFSRKKESN